jgi:iron complex transport system permease protein
VLLSSFVGACLAAAGVVYQAILRNPLADPYLLGISSGASLCAYAWKLPLAGLLGGSLLATISQQAFAFAGAIVVVGIVLTLATRRGRLEPVTLLLVGVIMNSILGAIFLLLNALFPALTAGMGDATVFLVGGIQTSLTRGQERCAFIIAGAGWVVLLYLAGQLNVATLHEAEAESLGVRIQRLRWTGLIVASLVTAAAVSISGSIGFVGLICPHLARKIVGPDHRRLLPWSTAFGAALLCCADAVSRLLASQDYAGTQLPVGVLTALLGGPFFLLLLWESRRESAK